MKWNLNWILKQNNHTFDFEEDLKFQKDAFLHFNNLLDLKDVKVKGTGRYFLKENRLYVDMSIKGIMIVPCAITLEEVEYPFDTSSTEVFCFDKPSPDEDVHEVKKNIVDITPVIFQNIMVEVPLRVVKKGATMKTEGKGWKVISNEEESMEPTIDPRLAKLKEYFNDKN